MEEETEEQDVEDDPYLTDDEFVDDDGDSEEEDIGIGDDDYRTHHSHHVTLVEHFDHLRH